MLFNSTLFLFYLPFVVWVSYQLTAKSREVFLLAASYFFYCVWSVPWSLLLLFAILHNWAIALIVDRYHSRRPIVVSAMTLSAILNLAPLALSSMPTSCRIPRTRCLGCVHGGAGSRASDGISFYTFQLMSYTIDVYRQEQKACRSLLDVALFALFFLNWLRDD